MTRIAAIGLLLCALLALGQSAQASITEGVKWYTLDAGANVSSAGSYQMSGTLGQPDTGISSNGSSQIRWGYWGKQPIKFTTTLPNGLQLQRSVTYGDLFKAGAFAVASLALAAKAVIRKWSLA